MKTQVHQQKSEDLQGNSLGLPFKKKSPNFRTGVKTTYLWQCDIIKTLSAIVCTDVQRVSWNKSNSIFLNFYNPVGCLRSYSGLLVKVANTRLSLSFKINLFHPASQLIFSMLSSCFPRGKKANHFDWILTDI